MDIMFFFLMLAALVAAAYTLISVIYPIKPFKTRRGAARTFAGLLWLVAFFLFGIGTSTNRQISLAQQAQGSKPNDLQPNTSAAGSSDKIGRYKVRDFEWDAETAPFKDKVVSVLNKLAEQHERCTQIDTESLTRYPITYKKDPTFMVACGKDNNIFMVDFKPSDADKDTEFELIPALSLFEAANLCEAYAKEIAVHPSTVDFSRFFHLQYVRYNSKRMRLITRFTTRNDYNLELAFKINCLFDQRELIYAIADEATE